MIKLKDLLSEAEELQQLPTELKKHFLEIISTYNTFQNQMKRNSDMTEVANTLGGIVEAAKDKCILRQAKFCPRKDTR